MVTLLPTLINQLANGSICMAQDEKDNPKTLLWPDISPVYHSFYNYNDDVLTIYCGQKSTVITVCVTYDNQIIIQDALPPSNSPMNYDFSSCEKGTYQVSIYSGTTPITSFHFFIY